MDREICLSINCSVFFPWAMSLRLLQLLECLRRPRILTPVALIRLCGV